MRIFGVDIIKGSVRSKGKRPYYALCVLENDEITAIEEVTRYGLLKKIIRERPDILAVDSLQEIAANSQEIYSFIQLLPPGTKLVQVTGGEKKESLGAVAARYNIRFNRLDPKSEAETAARVAGLGAGAEVVAFGNETEVRVSRARSPGKGGWSQNRYTRCIHGGVRDKANEIEAILKSEGLEYEKEIKSAFGGLSKVVFNVSAHRSQVPVNSSRGHYYQVKISGKRLDRISFRQRGGKKRYIIAGIDPGTTTGIAALDLNGKLMLLKSSRQMSPSDITTELYNAGKPLVIASDVTPMPFTVEKIRRAFTAIGYSPRRDMSTATKSGLAGIYGFKNDHERDSLAAAVEAYRKYKNKLENIRKRVPPGLDLDEIRAAVIRGNPLDKILSDLAGKPAEEKHTETKAEEYTAPEVSADELIRLDGMIKRLRGYAHELETGLQERDRRIDSLQKRLKKERSKSRKEHQKELEIVKRDSIITGLKKKLRQEERKVRKLKKKLDHMKGMEESGEEGQIPVKIMGSVTRDALKELEEDFSIYEGDILCVKRTDGWSRSVISELAEKRIGGIIASKDVYNQSDPRFTGELLMNGIPFIPVGDEEGGFMIRGKAGRIDSEFLEKAFDEWEEKIRKYEHERSHEKIETIFRDYRYERRKQLDRHQK